MLACHGCSSAIKRERPTESSIEKDKTTKLSKLKPQSGLAENKKDNNEGGAASLPDTKTVKIYFADSQAQQLVQEERIIKTDSTIESIKGIISELIKGPTKSDSNAIIPEEARLIDVKVNDQVATLDFSIEFIDKHPGGSAGETLTIYGIVDSLTEIPGIVGVRFLIEHEQRDSLAGHYDLKETFERNEELIQSK